MKDDLKPVATNRKARFNYHLKETFETRLVLVGSEVKSLRLGRASLADSYAAVDRGEAYLYNMHTSPCEQANRFNHEPWRTRKLLVHKDEIHPGEVGTDQNRDIILVPVGFRHHVKHQPHVHTFLTNLLSAIA